MMHIREEVIDRVNIVDDVVSVKPSLLSVSRTKKFFFNSAARCNMPDTQNRLMWHLNKVSAIQMKELL